MKVEVDFKFVKYVFNKAEGNLIYGEKVYFGERKFLSDAYNDLPYECKKVLNDECSKTIELLRHAGNII